MYGFIVCDQEVLVMSNKSNDKLWFPGGGIEIYETLEKGLKREVKEETGLDIEIERLVLTRENFFYYQPLDEAYHAFLFFYVCRPLSDEIIADEAVNDLESEKPRWKPISAIREEDIGDLSKDIYKQLQRLLVK